MQFAAELARVLDDGDNMRAPPIVTRGPFDNVYDLLYLRGVDAAIVYGDVLDHFKTKPEFANAWRRINYLLNQFPSETHIFARPEINSIKDLAGKVVNFNTEGTAAAYSGLAEHGPGGGAERRQVGPAHVRPPGPGGQGAAGSKAGPQRRGQPLAGRSVPGQCRLLRLRPGRPPGRLCRPPGKGQDLDVAVPVRVLPCWSAGTLRGRCGSWSRRSRRR